jgi:hypothetical protein
MKLEHSLKNQQNCLQQIETTPASYKAMNITNTTPIAVIYSTISRVSFTSTPSTTSLKMIWKFYQHKERREGAKSKFNFNEKTII